MSQPTQAHTPTPWHVGRIVTNLICCTAHPTRSAVAEVLLNDWDQSDPWISKERQAANAAFIVRACNAHEALVARVAALEEALEQSSNAMEDAIDRAGYTVPGVTDHRVSFGEPVWVCRFRELLAQNRAALALAKGTP